MQNGNFIENCICNLRCVKGLEVSHRFAYILINGLPIRPKEITFRQVCIYWCYLIIVSYYINRSDEEKDKEKKYREAEEGAYYHSYLGLDKLLSAQNPESTKAGKPAHSEMLFIITHQTYELWFKQILHELDSIIEIFTSIPILEADLQLVAQRLHRITEIQRILIEQIRVLETMTPMEFLDFRGLLTPASGFQSVQFRVLENRLGLIESKRVNYQNTTYTNYFKPEHQEVIQESEESDSLFNLVEKWLERTPFVEEKNYQFWTEYRKAVEEMLANERHITETNPLLTEESRNIQLQSQEGTAKSFREMFDENKYNDQRARGDRRFSYKACQAALFIYAYREQPVLQLPYRILNLLTEIDENMVTWRFRHVMMVQRMIGLKIGTGGSSGYYYLRSTVSDRYKIFLDLTTLSTYMIPHSALPPLHDSVRSRLGFSYSHKDILTSSEKD